MGGVDWDYGSPQLVLGMKLASPYCPYAQMR